jgi:hypothetical protein
MRFSAREHLASPWLDLAEDRLRLDRLSRNAVASTFFPWAFQPTGLAPGGTRFAHSSRTRSVYRMAYHEGVWSPIPTPGKLVAPGAFAAQGQLVR